MDKRKQNKNNNYIDSDNSDSDERIDKNKQLIKEQIKRIRKVKLKRDTNNSIKEAKITIPEDKNADIKEKAIHSSKQWYEFWKKEDKAKSNLSIKDKFILDRNPTETFLITMLFSNGTSKEFVIKTNKRTFIFAKKMYYLFYEEAYFNISSNQYQLIFHETCTCPINREIILDGDEGYFVNTPENMKDLLSMEYAKALVKTDGDKMNFLLIGVVIVIVILVIMMFRGG